MVPQTYVYLATTLDEQLRLDQWFKCHIVALHVQAEKRGERASTSTRGRIKSNQRKPVKML